MPFFEICRLAQQSVPAPDIFFSITGGEVLVFHDPVDSRKLDNISTVDCVGLGSLGNDLGKLGLVVRYPGRDPTFTKPSQR